MILRLYLNRVAPFLIRESSKSNKNTQKQDRSERRMALNIFQVIYCTISRKETETIMFPKKMSIALDNCNMQIKIIFRNRISEKPVHAFV